MTVDVPIYLSRWRAGLADGSKLLTPLEGLRDVSTRWRRDARPCRVEGRDCLDVALFQCGGLGQPRAVRFLLARRSSPALSYGSDGRKLVVGRVGSHWRAAPGNGACAGAPLGIKLRTRMLLKFLCCFKHLDLDDEVCIALRDGVPATSAHSGYCRPLLKLSSTRTGVADITSLPKGRNPN
jgi:hypothetical protein